MWWTLHPLLKSYLMPSEEGKSKHTDDAQLSKEIDMFTLYLCKYIHQEVVEVNIYKLVIDILDLTSVDCKTCFSMAPYVGNNIHSRLSDGMLVALILFKKYLKL